VDKAYRIADQLALSILYRLLREEGLFLGFSSGINLAGALRFAQEHGPGQTIVTVLCDSGHKYQSTLFNPSWLEARGLAPDRPIDTSPV
jgi:cysteine synthase